MTDPILEGMQRGLWLSGIFLLVAVPILFAFVLVRLVMGWM